MITSREKPIVRLATAQPILDGIQTLWQKLQRLPESGLRPGHNDFQPAIQRAYRRFARLHPRWPHSLFDEYFLSNAAAPVLNPINRRGRWPTAYELALAWYAQLCPRLGADSDIRVAAAMPIAAEFLELLAEEWSVHPRRDHKRMGNQ